MRVLLTGSSGQLGAYLVPRLLEGGHELIALGGPSSPSPLDLAAEGSIRGALDRHDPALVLHAAALSSAEAVRLDPVRADLINIRATEIIADWCRERARRLVYTSTDMVFDGTRPFWREDDPTAPSLAYGRSKRDAEPAIISTPGGLVARLALLYGPSRCGRPSFYDIALNDLRAGRPRAFFEDEHRTPLAYDQAAKYLVELIGVEAEGVVHVGGSERISRFTLMRRAAMGSGLDGSLVRPNLRADAPGPEHRPGDLSLDTTRLGDLLG